MKDITLKQLRFLAETVRAGSLAGAAAQLHVTGPAIAQQIRLLERRAGMALIERGPHGQRPTEAGRILADTCARIEAEIAVCAESLGSLRSAYTGHVRVGAVSTAKYFAPHVIASFQRANPGITVSLAVGNRDHILAEVENYAIDVAIMGRPPRRLDVVAEVFGEHPYVIIAAPDHRFVGRSEVPLFEVAEETFLVREPGSGTRMHVDALFAATGKQLLVGMEIASNETIKQAVIAGLGLAMISAHTIAAEVHDGRLAVLDVEGLPIRRDWLMVRMASRSVSPATTNLWDFFVHQARAQLPKVDV